jgi:hypothetical protein
MFSFRKQTFRVLIAGSHLTKSQRYHLLTLSSGLLMSGDYRHQFSVEVLAWGLRFPYHIILKFHLVVSIGHGQSRRRRQGISPETAYETPEIRKYFSSLIIRLCTSARSSRWTTYRRRSQRCEQALCSTHGRACATVNKRQ